MLGAQVVVEAAILLGNVVADEDATKDVTREVGSTILSVPGTPVALDVRLCCEDLVLDATHREDVTT